MLVLLLWAPSLRAAFLVPKFAALEITAAVGFAAFAVRRAAGDGPRWAPRVLVGVALVLATTLLSWCVAATRAEGAPYAFDAVARWGCLFGLACGAGALDDAPEERWWIVEVMMYGAAGVAVFGLFQHVDLLPHVIVIPVISLPGSTFGNRNLAAEVMAMAVPFGVAATAAPGDPESSRPRVLLGVATAIELWYLAVTRARGAWVGAALGIALALWLTGGSALGQLWRRSRGVLVGVAAVTVVAAALPGHWSAHDAGDAKRYEGLAHLALGALDPNSTALRTRFGYWRRTVPMLAEHPWVGVGPGNWPRVFPRFAQPNAIRDGVLTMALEPRQAHDDVIERTAETGVFGAAALAFLVWAVVVAARARLAKLTPDRPVTVGAAGALTALAVIAIPGFPLEMPGTLALAGLALGLVSMDPAERSSASRVSSIRTRLVAALGAVLVVFVVVRAERRVRSSRWLEVADRAIPRDDGAEDALAAARKSVDANPDDFVASLRVAQMLVREGRGSEAVAAAQRALMLEPHQVNALGTLADAYLTAGDNAHASEAASRGLEILDELPLALFVRIMANRGDPTKREAVDRDRAALARLALSPDRETHRVAAILLLEESERRDSVGSGGR